MEKLNRMFSLKPLVLGLWALGLSTSVFAATDTSEVKALRAELTQLKKEMGELKSDLRTHTQPISKKSSIKAHSRHNHEHRSAELIKDVDLIKVQREDGGLPTDYTVPGRSLVSTGPYIGIPLQFSGSNLIINSPSINIDRQLLGMRKAIENKIAQSHGQAAVEDFQRGHLLLSGVAEGQAKYHKGGSVSDGSDIDVTNVSLDAFVVGPSNWTQAFIELSYNNDYAFNDVYGATANGHRVGNSRVFVNKAFITIGDFNQSPFYATIGQYYVPFGTYASAMVSDPLTKSLARTKARAITVGFEQQADNAFSGAAYVFQGDSRASTNGGRINNGGVDFGYKFKSQGVSGKVGAGVIANLADSLGMQEGTGFWITATPSNQVLAHRVPAYNLRGSLSVGEHLDLIAEYVGASKRFNVLDMSFNNHGAKPWAIHTEADYSFLIMNDKPSSVGVGYDRTSEALALALPRDRYSAVFNTSLWRNTLQSLEFRHENAYSSSSTANSGRTTQLAINRVSMPGLGKSDNLVILQFDYYF